MFTNGVCVCSAPQPTVSQLTCSWSASDNGYICSYNVLWKDEMRLDPDYVEQRMDLFKSDVDGWAKSKYREPAILTN